MQLSQNAKLRVKWGLAIATLTFFMLHDFGVIFWILFWITAAVFLIVGNTIDLIFPSNPDE